MKKKSPKRKNKRENQEHPNLDPKYNLKTRTDLIDQDYLHKLSKKELAFLNKFNKEYVSASFEENPRKNLQKTKKLRKESYDRNNARNRCVLTREKAQNRLTDYETLVDEPDSNVNEDKLIENIDRDNIIEAITWLANQSNKDDLKLEKALTEESKDKEEL